jgi:hypothetical protein
MLPMACLERIATGAFLECQQCRLFNQTEAPPLKTLIKNNNATDYSKFFEKNITANTSIFS